MSEQLYVYDFSIWPSEVSGWRPAMYELFRMINTRFAKEFTEEAFEQFRNELAADGMTLREIERVPHHVPEGVL